MSARDQGFREGILAAEAYIEYHMVGIFDRDALELTDRLVAGIRALGQPDAAIISTHGEGQHFVDGYVVTVA